MIGVVSVVASIALIIRLVLAGSATDQIVDNYHVLDAISAATIGLGIALMIMAILADPPALTLVAVLVGRQIIFQVASEAIAVELAPGVAVALSGILLKGVTDWADDDWADDGWRKPRKAKSTRSGNPDWPSNPGSMDKAADTNVEANRLAQRYGYKSAENLKLDFVRKPASHWDMYWDTKTDVLWLRSKDGLAWVRTTISRK